jgi:hypothetical protein
MKFLNWLLQTMFPKFRETEPEPGWANMPPQYGDDE